MAVTLSSVQVRREQALREKLGGDRGVRGALAKLHQRSGGFGFGARRHLLTGGLRLTRAMAPEVADALHACKETLGFTRPVEVFVKPEPVFNAFCLEDPPGTIVIGLSSRLLEVFAPAELLFVLGHELGHAAFDHLAIPMPWTASVEDLAGRMVSRATALELFVWARTAELSADRIGLLCSRDPDAAASSFFKLASGMASPRVRPDLEAFAAQVDSLASVPQAREKPRDDDDTLDCFSTHPYSPVRVRALLAYSRSAAYAREQGKPAVGIDDATLEALLERDLDLMSPTYLEEKTSESELLRALLFNAGALVALANGVVDDKEIAALRALLGAERMSSVKSLPAVDALRQELERAAAEAMKTVSLAARARLVQHLTIVASADGSVDDAELQEMHAVAARLGVPNSVIHETLAAAAKPMD